MNEKNFQDESNLEANSKRIAGDLHDDFGSLLTGFKLSLRELSLKFPGNMYLEKSTGLLEESIGKLREVSLDLFPPELEAEGLNVAIETLVERMNAFTMLTIKYTPSFDDSAFELEKARLVYRVVQELTTNAIKHSSASIIEIGIVSKVTRLFIELRDNGSGFDFDNAKTKRKSSGLKHIQSRLELLNGILFVESKPGSGTHFFINIPLRHLTHGANKQNQNHSS
ncbi:MAG: ATP-binding protein [Bacteroidota bacterium]